MRIMNIGTCFLIGVISLCVFGIDTAIQANTKAASAPVWQRRCLATVADGKANIKCGDFSKSFEGVSDELLSAISQPRTVICKGFQTRGLASDITLECTA